VKDSKIVNDSSLYAYTAVTHWIESKKSIRFGKSNQIRIFFSESECSSKHQHCVNTKQRQAKSMADGKFCPSTESQPRADCHKMRHNWLCPREDHLNHIWYKSIHWKLLGKRVKC